MKYKKITITSVLVILIVLITVLYFCFSAFSASYGYQNTFSQMNKKEPKTIIIDAGHGGIDPGAVANGLVEKDLNLAIAKKLQSFLCLTDINVMLSRNDDVLLGDGDTVRKHKTADLKARLDLLTQTENAMLVSIHINKFTSPSAHGLQTFYAENTEGSDKLATYIQEASKLLDGSNKRSVKPDDGNIYILENADKTAVLIECGFISNPSEAKLLSTEDYQNKLAFVIYTGIIRFLQES